MEIHRSLIKDFVMPKIKSVFVIDYYKGIQGLLASRDEFSYDDFLANPKTRTQKEIVWHTDAFEETPRLLSQLVGVEKNNYAVALKKRIECIEMIINQLKEEGDLPLSDLLSKVISYIDENDVYCGNGKIFVVNWGMMPRRPQLGIGGVYRSGKFISDWDKKYLSAQQQTVKTFETKDEILPDPDPSFKGVGKEEEIVDKPEKPETLQDPESELAAEESELQEIPSDEPPRSEKTVKEVVSRTSEQIPPVERGERNIKETLDDKKVITSDVTGDADTENEKAIKRDWVSEERHPSYEEEDSQETENVTETAKEEEPVREKNVGSDHPHRKKEDTWKSFFSGLRDGVIFLLRKLWKLLLLILILLLMLYLCRGCQNAANQYNPFYNPLPDEPYILPIDKDNVGMSADGMTQIATDRLNILLEKEGENTLQDWAKAFKKEYPGNEYYIFFYDKSLYNVQIKVPVAERELIKKEIQSKIKGFSFDVFDEPVYVSDDISLNDPELGNAQRAWYLDAIGAKEAWNYTLGDPDVVVAVVDNGFDLSHPELNDKIVHPYNVLTQNSDIRPIITNKGENGHGTHVAATAVGSCNNGTGLLGIAPKCKLMPVQVANDNPTGTMSDQAIRTGVLYAIEHGADVINISLGMYVSDQVKGMSDGQQLNYINTYMKDNELLWNKIFAKAKERNCIIVFAAGNDNVISGIDPKKRNNETIRVSAVNGSLAKADFSNYGRYGQLNREYSSVSAPGVSIFSAMPHNQYGNMNGTSMAAPIVTGIVALMKSVNRNLTANQALSILKSTGNELSPNIGPLVQVGRAIRKTMGKGDSDADCEAIAERVKRLQAEIDSLCQICPDAGSPEDTLKYKDAVKNKNGLDGFWKTTTALVSTTDNSPVELYMQFMGSKGKLIIKNHGREYTAKLRVKIGKSRVTITQSDDARCSSNYKETFSKYFYTCTSDRKGNFICHAKSNVNSTSFNLIRIR